VGEEALMEALAITALGFTFSGAQLSFVLFGVALIVGAVWFFGPQRRR
jgi:hypothetical protein